MNELIVCMQNTPEKTYDFISNNYYKMSKEDFVNLAKELVYAISKMVDEQDILYDVAEELRLQYME